VQFNLGDEFMEFGKTLKQRREEKDYSLEYVQEETKIRKYYLEALENENFSVLPPRVYATGFVKKYARFLELNEKEMVEEFINLAYGNTDEEEMIYEDDNLEKKGFSYKNIAAAVVFLLVAIWLGNYLVNVFANNYSDPGKPPVEEPGNINSEAPGPDNRADSDNNEKEIVVKASLLIEGKSDCWVRIVVDGDEQFSGIITAGENKYFEGNESIYIKAGNAGGIDLTYNGNKIEPLGSLNAVEEKTFLAEEQEVE
jgi:cytoskeletal protein RodZ